MPLTYEPITTTTLTTTAQFIDLTSIPGTYTDLKLVVSAITTSGGSNPWIQYNSDTGSNYNQFKINANAGNSGNVAASNIASNTLIYLCWSDNANQSQPSLFVVDIFNYAASKFKSSIQTANYKNMTSDYVITERILSTWRSTSAITSIRVGTNSPAPYLKAGTTVTLFGIKNA